MHWLHLSPSSVQSVVVARTKKNSNYLYVIDQCLTYSELKWMVCGSKPEFTAVVLITVTSIGKKWQSICYVMYDYCVWNLYMTLCNGEFTCFVDSRLMTDFAEAMYDCGDCDSHAVCRTTSGVWAESNCETGKRHTFDNLAVNLEWWWMCSVADILQFYFLSRQRV